MRLVFLIFTFLALALPAHAEVVLVKHHVAQRADTGEIAITNDTLDYYIDRLNEAFYPTGIAFYPDPVVHYIVDTNLFKYGVKPNIVRQYPRTVGAMNVYWMNELQPEGLCANATYSWQQERQGIVMKTSCPDATDNPDVSNIFIHTVGHYFDLHHTHIHTTCPETGNCAIDNDGICDTLTSPPLYFDICVDPDTCEMRENAPSYCYEIDECVFEEIDTRNYMSWTAIECMSEFTEGQIEKIQETYEIRTELHTPPLPRCIGDFDGNGTIDVMDLLFLIDGWRGDQADLTGDAWAYWGDLTFILDFKSAVPDFRSHG